MESFEIQLFVFSMLAALTVVFILVYTLMKRYLGKDEPADEEAKPEASPRRAPVRRLNDTKPVLLSKPGKEADGNE